ncbi:MAG: stage IV sporulation protein A [Clostridia bacterium]|nr:stage IV sporulation protein A [Clostridia bacterium]
MNQTNLYSDIALRSGGDIYIGVVGPVRTGKSTFIKRFMELSVLPNMTDSHKRDRAIDELPVSGAGKTITTVEPRFVPAEAAEIHLKDNASFRVKMIDCVGFLIDGALGTTDGEETRMVRTPWFDHDIPLETAADIGTKKVIGEHSTVGLVVTTDGSFTDLERRAYEEAEERAAKELISLNKPFVIILNTVKPESRETNELRSSLSKKYSVPVISLNAETMTERDVNQILESLLFEFPLTEIHFDLPTWLGALEETHYLNESILGTIKASTNDLKHMRDYETLIARMNESEYIDEIRPTEILLSEGAIDLKASLTDGLFFKILGEASGQNVDGEEHLLKLMKELVDAKKKYDRVKDALNSVEATGYGLVAPEMEELTLEEPEIVKQGSRFGVKLKAGAPSLHMIRVDIQTEVSPIVGTEKQSEELVKDLLSGFESDPKSLWETQIFGRSLNELVREGLSGKLMRMPDDIRMKVQKTLSKIINEGNGGFICILL